MKKIFKYLMKTDGKMQLPKGVNILSVKAINNDIYLWAMVDTEAEIIPVDFAVVGTGFEIEDHIDDLIFIDTALLVNGLVFHVFLKKEKVGMPINITEIK